MDQSPKLSQLCILTALLFVGFAGFLSLFGFESSWDFIANDIRSNVTHISHVHVVQEFPLSDETFSDILDGKNLKSKSTPIRVSSRSSMRWDLERILGKFTDKGKITSDDKGKRFAVYADVPMSGDWFLYYYSAGNPYDFYVNDTLYHAGQKRSEYLGEGRIHLPNPMNRLTWVFTNTSENALHGLDFRHGLSLRSDRAMSDTYRRLPVQVQFPLIVTATSFFVIGLIALAFAMSAKTYLDIWAFAAFSIATALYVWSHSPMFFENFQERAGGLFAVRSGAAACSIVFATILSLAYFRLEGRHVRLGEYLSALKPSQFSLLPQRLIKGLTRPFRAVVAFTMVLAALPLARDWPPLVQGNLGAALGRIHEGLFQALLISQALAVLFGFHCLFNARSRFVRLGLDAQVTMMSRRIVVSLAFCLGMAAMLLVYVEGFGKLPLAGASDYVLIAAIFPAASMLLMFFWMVSSSSRFYQKYAPRPGQIDHEVMVFGPKALDKRYFGALFMARLGGVARLHAVAARSTEVARAVENFLGEYARELTPLIQKSRVVHRVRSHGGEVVCALRASDAEEAEALALDMVQTWREDRAPFMSSLRGTLEENLKGHVDDKLASELAASLEIQVLVTSMKSMSITVRGNPANPEQAPDFADPRYAGLVALLDMGSEEKVIMHADDGHRVIAACSEGARFVPLDDDPTVGYVDLASERFHAKAS